MEASAFGAFIGNDEVHVHGLGRVGGIGIVGVAHGRRHRAMQGGTISQSPFGTTFIDGVVRTFRFACTAVDAFVGDHYRHGATVYFWAIQEVVTYNGHRSGIGVAKIGVAKYPHEDNTTTYDGQ